MKYLLDTSILIESERENFELAEWIKPDDEIFICGATLTEFLAGEPLKDEGKRKRFRDFWASLALPVLPLTNQVCQQAGALIFLARTRGKTVPLGDGLHAAVAELENLHVLTKDTGHYSDMGIACVNPLKSQNPPGK